MATDVTVVVNGLLGVAIFPRPVWNTSQDLNFYFRDLQGNLMPWSGQTGYTLDFRISSFKWGRQLEPGDDDGITGKGFTISDGSKSRELFLPTTASYGGGGLAGLTNPHTQIFNAHSISGGLDPNAVWAAAKVYVRGTAGFYLVECTAVGLQAALNVTVNGTTPLAAIYIDVVRPGTGSVTHMVLIRTKLNPIWASSSFSQITNGWLHTLNITDPRFLYAIDPVAGYGDLDCELVVKDGGGAIVCVMQSRIRIYIKRIASTL
jgi:hypothetical protein